MLLAKTLDWPCNLAMAQSAVVAEVVAAEGQEQPELVAVVVGELEGQQLESAVVDVAEPMPMGGNFHV